MTKMNIKKMINWKTFSLLLISCALTSLLVIPYSAGLNPALSDLGAMLYAGAFLQGAVLFSIFIFFGLLLAQKTGYRLPVFEGGDKRETLKSILVPSALWGLLSGILTTLLALPLGKVSLELLAAERVVPVWARFLAIFYGGIAEEVFMRLFVMSLLTWAFRKMKLTDNVSSWAAILLSAVLFGLGHLPMTGELTAITGAVVARAVLLNGVVGIVFGVLYWKKGLESAMIAHFSAGIVLRFVAPYAAGLFL